jgi:general secretion pathway protein G
MRRRGFTLIELVITVAIVSLLATVVIPSAQLAFQRQREAELKVALRTIRSAIDAYKQASDTGRIKRLADKSGYPPSLKALSEGTDDASDPKAQHKLYFLRRLPRDPFWPDATTPPEETWALRCYQSPPDDPQPGDDVYDVSSRSKKIGLNGVPYHDW